MTTGLLYAAIFYFASVLLGGIFGLAYHGFRAEAVGILVIFAKMIGPLLAIAGFCLGFFIQKRKEAQSPR